MRTRRGALLVSVSIAAALGIGSWRFPHALDPGGNERNRIVLNSLVDHGAGNVANDWFRVSPTAKIASTPGALSITAPSAQPEIDVTSRSLPVLSASCYGLEIRAIVNKTGASGAVFDENVLKRLALFSFPARPGGTISIRFPTNGRQRVTVVIYGFHLSNVIVRQTVLRRLTPRDCRP
jgi:hypothetical protein